MLNKMLLGKEISQKRYAIDKRVSPAKMLPSCGLHWPEGKNSIDHDYVGLSSHTYPSVLLVKERHPLLETLIF